MGYENIDFLADVANYYSLKLATHGETPLGVDWNGEKSQVLRFEQLTQVISHPENFSLNDLGCGYGALFDYLSVHYRNFSYTGYDISDNMIRTARNRHSQKINPRFILSQIPSEAADFCIASGIFNVKLERSDSEWQRYLENTLDAMNRTSRLGFAFNCLTSYSDADKMQNHLHYIDPSILFTHCKQNYSRNIALLHDYGLYEFTIIVRKNIE